MIIGTICIIAFIYIDNIVYNKIQLKIDKQGFIDVPEQTSLHRNAFCYFQCIINPQLRHYHFVYGMTKLFLSLVLVILFLTGLVIENVIYRMYWTHILYYLKMISETLDFS